MSKISSIDDEEEYICNDCKEKFLFLMNDDCKGINHYMGNVCGACSMTTNADMASYYYPIDYIGESHVPYLLHVAQELPNKDFDHKNAAPHFLIRDVIQQDGRNLVHRSRWSYYV
jgi:hypothetical protein